MQKRKIKAYLEPYTIINSKWITNLNLEAKTIEHLEQTHLVETFLRPWVRKRFLGRAQKAQIIKQLIKTYVIKIKHYSLSNTQLRTCKDNPQTGPGTVAHVCNPRTLGGRGGRITWGQEFETSQANMVKPQLYWNYKKLAGHGGGRM